MANFFRGLAGRKSNANLNKPSPTSSTAPTVYSSQNDSPSESFEVIDTPKYFFQEKYARTGIKGNFMPLAAQPKYVDLPDWLAHQATEQYSLMSKLIATLQEVDSNTGLPICNHKCCPTMSAGPAHVYTWLNNMKEPVRVPAQQYISLVQRWIVGKLSDNRTFPTDPLTGATGAYASSNPPMTPSSETPIPAGPTTIKAPLAALAGPDWFGKSTGFPQNFLTDIRTIFRQMFRIYAHIYHSHFIDPFWHIRSENPPSNGWVDLNSCFVHFISVAMLFGLLTEKDMEPMAPLIRIWVGNGTIPSDAAHSICAIGPMNPPMQQAQGQSQQNQTLQATQQGQQLANSGGYQTQGQQ